MINVRLSGGLGNQLFQLAAALYLRKYTPIRLITKALSNYSTPRHPEILKLIDCNKLNLIPINKLTHVDNFFSKARIGRFMPIIGINDRNFKDFGKGSCRYAWLDGYFQDAWSTRDLESIYQIIQEALIIQNCDFERVADLAIHIRGGDFLNHNQLDIVDAEWYVSSIKRLNNLERINSALVLTDDFEYAKRSIEVFQRAFPQIDFKITRNHNLIEDFNLLRCARLKIIGNSTFALCACLLSPLTGKIVAPEWLGVGRPRYWLLPGEHKPSKS